MLTNRPHNLRVMHCIHAYAYARYAHLPTVSVEVCRSLSAEGGRRKVEPEHNITYSSTLLQYLTPVPLLQVS